MFGVGLPGYVAHAASGLQGGVLRQGIIRPGSAAEEEGAQGPGELPRVGADPGLGGQVDGGEQGGVLGREPGHRVLGRGRFADDDPGPAASRVSGSKCGSISSADR